jgi:hypothetical protein
MTADTEAQRATPGGLKIMRAISIRSPWWWFILHAGKDIENRDWATSYRGPVLIHASKWFGRQAVCDDFRLAQGISGRSDLPPVTLGALRSMGGYVVGAVDIVDCVIASESPWFFGKHGFVLRNPRLVEPYPAKGTLGLFTPSPAVRCGNGA